MSTTTLSKIITIKRKDGLNDSVAPRDHTCPEAAVFRLT